MFICVLFKVFIQGSQNLNRAVHDDIVAVEMLKEEDWSCPSSMILVHTEDKDDADEEENEEVSDTFNDSDG